MRSYTKALRRTGVAVALAFVAALLGHPAYGQLLPAQELVLEVDPDASSFRAPAGLPGPFYIEGKIYPGGTLRSDGTAPEGATSIGNFRCWGFIAPSALSGGSVGVVAQEFEIFGRGKLQVQGVESNAPRAVTGGTGDFRFVRGQADIMFFPDDPEELSFRSTFRILSGVRR